ncbi:hypothetical protein Vadar_006850 [Vaccinium darrowii]|uniref:Uncharacterized protein n=1 Tax=Vaccinium darrowii TaxID=229202 RepID=A0ACB7YU06_9ERIC|nr:hypothetical protein Vadar_006850 [Vaccinium darrowii]
MASNFWLDYEVTFGFGRGRPSGSAGQCEVAVGAFLLLFTGPEDHNQMGILASSAVSRKPKDRLVGCSAVCRKPNEGMRLIVANLVGLVFGFLIGVSFPMITLMKDKDSGLLTYTVLNPWSALNGNNDTSMEANKLISSPKIWVPSNPRGAERLPPRIVAAESDLYLRRLWGLPSEVISLFMILNLSLQDVTIKQRYLVTFTVGYGQKDNVDAAVKKATSQYFYFIMMDEQLNGMSLSGQSELFMWYAKRFLHPDIVAAYDYIFIWDEDLGVEHFNAEEYIRLVRKHGLEISQPGLEPTKLLHWAMTKRITDREVHKFVEIMAPVFSRNAWRCVWHLVQNDLVHGWGLDFALHKCVEPAHEKMGVVDAQWIVHQTIPSLGNQGKAENGKSPLQGVKERFKRRDEALRAIDDLDGFLIRGLKMFVQLAKYSKSSSPFSRNSQKVDEGNKNGFLASNSCIWKPIAGMDNSKQSASCIPSYVGIVSRGKSKLADGKVMGSDWLQNSVVGKLISYCYVNTLQDLFISNGIWDAHIRPLGGRNVLVSFKSYELWNTFLKDKDNVLPNWSLLWRHGIVRVSNLLGAFGFLVTVFL